MTDDTDTAMTAAAMQILLQSGEARTHVSRALEAVALFDFETASQCLAAAQTPLREAHRRHTDVIQAEARAQGSEPTLLFNHAQDTMMTTDAEIRLVRRLLPVLRAIVDRLPAGDGPAAALPPALPPTESGDPA